MSPKITIPNTTIKCLLLSVPGLVNVNKKLLKPWPSRNSGYTWIYPLNIGGFSSSLCKRLPEGKNHAQVGLMVLGLPSSPMIHHYTHHILHHNQWLIIALPWNQWLHTHYIIVSPWFLRKVCSVYFIAAILTYYIYIYTTNIIGYIILYPLILIHGGSWIGAS